MLTKNILPHNLVVKEKNGKLKEELQSINDHLKKYTAPSNMKKYYENHKEEIKQKVKEYKIAKNNKFS